MLKTVILLATFIFTVSCSNDKTTSSDPSSQMTPALMCGISCAFTFMDLPANINAAPEANKAAGQAFVKECIPKCLACGNLSSDAAKNACLNNIK